MNKLCSKCKISKPLIEFSLRSKRKSGRSSHCKTCVNSRRRAIHDPIKAKNEILKARFGITLDQYNQLLLAQNECCKICKKHKSHFTKALSVDHKHGTTIIRGLLCDRCNRAIGLLKDSSEAALEASKYLQQTESQIVVTPIEDRPKRYMRIV